MAPRTRTTQNKRVAVPLERRVDTQRSSVFAFSLIRAQEAVRRGAQLAYIRSYRASAAELTFEVSLRVSVRASAYLISSARRRKQREDATTHDKKLK